MLPLELYEEKFDQKCLPCFGTINLATGILTGIYKKMNYNAIIEVWENIKFQ